MKIALKLSVLCSLMCVFPLSCSTKADFEAFAHEWIATYVQSSNGYLLVSPQELNILLNLTFISYKRSACTIAAQEQAFQALNASWRLLQNVTQTRLNPAHSIPYKLELKQYGNLMKQAWQNQQDHEFICSTYAQMIEFIFDDQTISNQLLKSIKTLRVQARAALIDSLAAIKEYIESLIEECQKKPSEDGISSDSSLVQKNGFIDYLVEMIPPLAAHSFIAVDDIGIEAGEEGWKVLSELERIHNLIWMVIEQRRANFYAIMYRSLYAVAKAEKLEKSVFLVSFDNEGPISVDAQSSPLPDPRKIALFE